jgi:glycosyltransferase involved in cell wall biosynthesis
MHSSNHPNSPQRICHIISGDLWAGAEAQVYHLINELSGIKSLTVSVIVFNDGILAKKLKLREIKTTIVNEHNKPFLSFLKELCKELKAVKPDIIHVHGYKEAIIGGLAGRICGIDKLIRTHHGKGVLDGCLKHRILEFFIARFLIKWNIAVSEDLKKFLIEKGIAKEINIRVIHNGVATQEIVCRKSRKVLKEELGISQDAFVIGTLGRMVAVKGHSYFLEGAKQVKALKSNVIFVLAGDGPLKADAMNFIQQERLDETVKLLGFRNDPYDLLNMFDVFALTSLHEGIPMVLLEAMSLEKPIVATAVGGIPEILTNRDTALLIEPRNSFLFAKACVELIENTRFRETIAKNAKNKLLENYTININAQKAMALYEEAA